MPASVATTPIAVAVRGVTRRYGPVVAVRDITLDAGAGAVTVLVGPSGCGKTTLLRLVGGFETPDEGRILIGDADVTDWPAQRRPTATVFQSYALFPSMTVGGNVGYGLRVRRRPRAEVARRVELALDRVGLTGLGDRSVAALSGGQQQRVALARALAVEPRVLLFDEPLSNLDPELRDATRAEVRELLHELGATALWVTHDRAEALAMGDRIAVMRDGGIVEEGTPEQLHASPARAFTARFLSGANVVTDVGLASRLAGQQTPDGCALSIQPDAMMFDPAGVPAAVRGRLFQGTHVEWTVEVEGGGADMRMWTLPDIVPPEAPAVRATRWRWVEE
jgi:ABC-type Fe3+/spermidine/putrescine transport system ATPase subunit